MRGSATIVAVVAVLFGCSRDEAITVELDEVNSSGITGTVEP